MPKVCLTSDLHGSLPEIPECDLLVIAGDVCPDFPRWHRRTGQKLKGDDSQAIWLRRTFIPWAQKQPVGRIVLIAGNHDFVFESTHLIPRDEFEAVGIIYLRDQSTNVEGVYLYGTPWVPNLPSWAFYGDSAQLERVYERVPVGLDLLVTHGPPYGYGDKTNMRFASDPADFDGHVGSLECLAAVHAQAPRYVVFGHIHEGYGYYRIPIDCDPYSYAHAYNVAHNDERYDPRNAPVVIDL